MGKNKKIIIFKYLPGLLIVLTLGINTEILAQSRIKSVPFSYLPEASEDTYNQRIREKTLIIDETHYLVLSKKGGRDYAVSLYNGDLKKLWEVVIPLAGQEDLESFSQDGTSALVLTNRKPAGSGTQGIYAHLIDLKTGRKQEPKKLFEAPAGSRRIGTARSADGSKLVTYQYLYQQDQLKAIAATVFDGQLKKIKDRTYNFRDVPGIQSANVQVDNTGNQYVSLITGKATKLSVRRYNHTNNEVNGMDIQVGGVFEGKSVYVLDTYFTVQPNGNLYAAAICADEKTGEYFSLKVVKFDFDAQDMKFAPEFRFTPQYLADLNKLNKAGETPGKRLEDIYLSEIVVSSENQLLVVAEKKYNEGPKLPYVTKEMHLFAYDEFLNNSWHSLVNKYQKAPAEEGFTGLSYKSKVFQNDFHLLTLENLNGKTDLFLRRINLKTGISEAPKPLGLNVASQKSLAYIRDFTSWIDAKNILAVVRPSQKSAVLQLNKITVK